MVRFVFINEIFKHKDLFVYELDTQDSVINRLASELNTIPKFLYFNDGIPSLEELHKETPIKVENLLNTIIITKKEFVELINELNQENKLEQQNLQVLDILSLFFAYNQELIENYKKLESKRADLGHIFLKFKTDIETIGLDLRIEEIKKYWEKSKDKRDEISKLIKKNKDDALVEKGLFKNFEEIDKRIQYTEFELESVKFNFTIDVKNITVMELFNNIVLNNEVPFACINKFFKIFKNFTPPEDWSFYDESVILFKVLTKKTIEGSKIEDYIDTFVSVEGEEGEETAKVTMKTFISANGKYLSQKELISRFLNTITNLGSIFATNITETRVNGSFYFPNHNMNKYVIADLIMNNPTFSSLMSINESDKASKKKESVYIHFYNPKIGNLTANLTEKIAERNDPELRGKNKAEFKQGTYYIRVKITSADNINAVEAFQELFSKLMIVYDQEYQTIVDFYSEYIKDFGKIKQSKTQTRTKLTIKDIAPEVFVTGYPQRCPQAPTIIDDDEELEKALKDGYEIMTYPKETESTKNFPSRKYICKDPVAKFPGLRDNPLENKDVVPYLPCCYQKTHNKKDCGSILRHYEFGEKLPEKKAEQQDLIKTKRFANQDSYGTLPDNIKKLFEIFDYDQEYTYVRKGMYNGNSSFLQCVMEAMDTDILESDDTEKRLIEEREKMATPENAALCRQEMYDYTTEEIINIIRNPEVYMNPSLFTSLLEQYFNCNIFVFNRTNEDGELIIPRHTQAYYKNKRNANCIFIYEHIGSNADKGIYEGVHCELIIKWKKTDKKDLTYALPYNSKISKGVRKIFNRMCQTYVLNIEIKQSLLPEDVNVSDLFFYQGIDSYGKCRMLKFKFKGVIGTLLTEPIQPFPIIEEKGWLATTIPNEVAIDFANDNSMVLTGQRVVNDVLKELYFNFGNIKVSIPVLDDEKFEDLTTIDQVENYPTKSVSVLEKHNKYKQLSRCIIEYMFWLFSRYLKEDPRRLLSDPDTINDFAREKIKIDKKFKYKKVSNIFNEQSCVMNDNKLVVKSEETLKRLLYTLRLSLRSFGKKIEKYHEKKIIENFYIDVTDFDQHPQQVILNGDDSVEKWNLEKKHNNRINNSVQEELQLPYFFQNQLVDNNTFFLAQNTTTLEKAFAIAETWFESGYNPGYDAKDSKNRYEFNLYVYVNSIDIVLYKIKGAQTLNNIRILGYKIEGKSFFTVLLDL
jgi:hypothetical protein